MSDAVAVLKNDPDFAQILTYFSNPILGVLAGTILTAIVQSSSASIGILQALSVTGAISYGTAIPIILGQNIGTCVTAMLSAMGANKNGKRTAVAHLFFNVIGVVFWLIIYYLVGWILDFTKVFDLFGLANGTTINMWGIAAVHTVFKILAIALMWPFTKLLEKLACSIVKGSDKKEDEFTSMLDDRLLDTPSIAIDRCRKVAIQMGELSVVPFNNAVRLLNKYNDKIAQDIRDAEDKVDLYEDALGSYLVKLSAHDLSEAESLEVTKLLHIIGDFERISDHSVNIVESAEEMKDKNLSFSEYAVRELQIMSEALEEITSITQQAFAETSIDKASLVEPLEQVVDDIKDQIKLQHVIRVQKSMCTIEHGFVLSDILNNLERVSDHCSNVAGCVIELSKHDSIDMHYYLRELKAGGKEFEENYKKYLAKYSLPAFEEN
jgi:phosphate:Na+ symporter